MKTSSISHRVGRLGSSASLRMIREDQLAAGIITVFAISMLVLGSSLNLWIDELYTLHSTASGPLDSFKAAITFEQQPPLYFMALSAWRSISMSDVFARCFSIACAVATLGILYRFARLHFSSFRPAIFLALVAMNPFFIWTALEIRTYAPILTETAIIATSFYDGFFMARLNRRAIYVFALTSVAGLYTQYYMGFIVVGCALSVLILKRDRIASLVIAIAPFLVACIPAGAVALWQAHQIDHASVREVANVKGLIATVQTFLFPRDWAEREFDVGAMPKIAYTIFVASCAIRPIQELKRFKPSLEARAFIVIATTITVLFLALVLLHTEIYFPRHVAALYVPLVLAAFAFIAPICRRSPSYKWSLISGYVLLAVISLIFVYRPLAKHGDWQRVGKYLEQHTAAGDVVDVFDAEMAIAVGHYYRGPAAVEPIPVAPFFDHWDIGPYKITSLGAVRQAFDRVPPSGRRWLVINPYPCPQVETVEGCRNVMRYVLSTYHITSERSFYQTGVLLLSPRRS